MLVQAHISGEFTVGVDIVNADAYASTGRLPSTETEGACSLEVLFAPYWDESGGILLEYTRRSLFLHRVALRASALEEFAPEWIPAFG